MNIAKEKEVKQPFRMDFKILLIIWGCTVAVVITLFILSETVFVAIIKGETFQVLSNFLALVTFLTTSLLSFSLIKNSKDINEQNQRNSAEINARNESFRTLQFIASNYAAIDFVDYMLIYEAYKRYVDDTKKTKNFSLFMREENVSLDDINANYDDFTFVTVRIPIIPLASGNKSVTSIRFSNFVFHKEDSLHQIVACCDVERNALILYNKDDRCQEVVVNLIVRKSSGFWIQDKVNPFLKISFNHTMYSLLGVEVSGWTELYFVNPEKVEKSGANKYTINSSQFEISGLPKLSALVEKDIIGQV